MDDKTCTVQVALPKYKCHKEVHALKIDRLERDADKRGPNEETDGSITVFDDKVGGLMNLDAAFVNRHKPEVGGYIVLYEDGYKSFSPAKAFDDGYKLVPSWRAREEELRGIVARGYCHKKNSHKELDGDLLEAIVQELLLSVR